MTVTVDPPTVAVEPAAVTVEPPTVSVVPPIVTVLPPPAAVTVLVIVVVLPEDGDEDIAAYVTPIPTTSPTINNIAIVSVDDAIERVYEIASDKNITLNGNCEISDDSKEPPDHFFVIEYRRRRVLS